MAIILLVQCTLVDIENTSHINDDIHEAFADIGDYVKNKYYEMSERGLDPEKYMNRSELWLFWELESLENPYLQPGPDPAGNEQRNWKSDVEHYNDLSKRGFKLPLLYRDGYQPKYPWWKFWKHF